MQNEIKHLHSLEIIMHHLKKSSNKNQCIRGNVCGKQIPECHSALKEPNSMLRKDWRVDLLKKFLFEIISKKN